MENLFRLYCHGQYDACIEAIKKHHQETGQTHPRLDELLIQAYIRGNYTDKAVYQTIKLYQLLHNIDNNQELFQNYYDTLKRDHISRTGLQILCDLKELAAEQPNYSALYQETLNTIRADCTGQGRKLIVYPMIWPIAFGDMIVMHQFIKQKKKENPGCAILVIMPLNRKDLLDLAALNEAIDYLVDITLLPEAEKNRLQSLRLPNQGVLNVSRQEYIISRILHDLKKNNVDFDIEKTRYFPVLDGHPYHGGWRVWEKRAEMFIADALELPKLVEQKFPKQNKVTCHFREAKYGTDTRNMLPSQAQALIDLLIQNYPGYELVRLGDPSMSPLRNCTDHAHANLSLAEQIREIQESRLFIGTWSAPQHLAVACSDTPVICTHYGLPPESLGLGDMISKMANEPVGRQVKAVLYNKTYDLQGNQLEPRPEQQNVTIVQPENQDILAAARAVLT